MTEKQEKLKSEILKLVSQYAAEEKKKEFVPGKTKVHYAGRIYDRDELELLVDSSLEFWLTAGRYAAQFEHDFAAFFGLPFCSLTNSGSSANLLALSCLTSERLGDRRLEKGDKVITCAAGFPTTANPIYQNGLLPVYVDVEVGTYNADVAGIEEAAENGARAIMLAHTLGNPFDLEKVSAIAKKHNMYLIEDCCDAVGAKFDSQPIGSFGDLATVSFYPAHHMTMGEGGAVLTKNPLLHKLVESFRDWGRDCWCPPGKSDTCGKRFMWKLGELPQGYDHKYIYSNIGYNLKVTDMQAAIGVAQIRKLPSFIAARKDNFNYYMKEFSAYSDSLILPKKHPKAEPSPFGLPLSVKENAGFSRNDIVKFLEGKNIETRMLFGGNLVRQPAYVKKKHETIGKLSNADFVMNNTFWIGVYPGITHEMREYVAKCFKEFFSTKTKHK